MLGAIAIITALSLVGVTAAICAILVSDLTKLYYRMKRYDALMKEIEDLENNEKTPEA